MGARARGASRAGLSELRLTRRCATAGVRSVWPRLADATVLQDGHTQRECGQHPERSGRRLHRLDGGSFAACSLHAIVGVPYWIHEGRSSHEPPRSGVAAGSSELDRVGCSRKPYGLLLIISYGACRTRYCLLYTM